MASAVKTEAVPQGEFERSSFLSSDQPARSCHDMNARQAQLHNKTKHDVWRECHKILKIMDVLISLNDCTMTYGLNVRVS